MLCEVCYFFCGRTDSYFEENAKDGTISGRNHLRKELVMKVESSSYEAYLEALEEWKQKMQETQATQQKEENSATDSYVPGISQMDMDIPMPSSTYNAQGMMSGERPPMPPMPPQETEETDETTESTQVTGTTETQGTAATGTEALLEELSEASAQTETGNDAPAREVGNSGGGSPAIYGTGLRNNVNRKLAPTQKYQQRVKKEL